jgi:hypothetical protein
LEINSLLAKAKRTPQIPAPVISAAIFIPSVPSMESIASIHTAIEIDQ